MTTSTSRSSCLSTQPKGQTCLKNLSKRGVWRKLGLRAPGPDHTADLGCPVRAGCSLNKPLPSHPLLRMVRLRPGKPGAGLRPDLRSKRTSATVSSARMQIWGAGTRWSAPVVRKGSGTQEVLTTCPDPAPPAPTVNGPEKTGSEPGVPLAPSQPSPRPGAHSPSGETKAGQPPPARTYRARCSHGGPGAPKAPKKAASAVAARSVSAPPTAANSNAGRVATPRPRRLKETQLLGFWSPGRKQRPVARSTASARSSARPAAHGRRRQRSPSTVTNPLRNHKPRMRDSLHRPVARFTRRQAQPSGKCSFKTAVTLSLEESGTTLPKIL